MRIKQLTLTNVTGASKTRLLAMPFRKQTDLLERAVINLKSLALKPWFSRLLNLKRLSTSNSDKKRSCCLYQHERKGRSSTTIPYLS
ncbi:hypothetical protein O9993_18845 [Vibrio lentus]|nr:hypothetical protein [Vibrio lentus]